MSSSAANARRESLTTAPWLRRLVRVADSAAIDDSETLDGRGRQRRYFVLTEEGTEALRTEAGRLEELAALTHSKTALEKEPAR